MSLNLIFLVFGLAFVAGQSPNCQGNTCVAFYRASEMFRISGGGLFDCARLNDAAITATQDTVATYLRSNDLSGFILDFSVKAVKVQFMWIMYGIVSLPSGKEFVNFCEDKKYVEKVVCSHREIISNYMNLINKGKVGYSQLIYFSILYSKNKYEL